MNYLTDVEEGNNNGTDGEKEYGDKDITVSTQIAYIKNDKQDMIQEISKENEDLYLMPYHFGRGFEKYKDIKRKFIFNIILSPILVVVLWFIFIYINPIIAVVVFGMAIVMIPKEMSAQYKVIKAKRKKDGK